MHTLNRSLKKLCNAAFMTLLLSSIMFANESDCVRYRQKLKEGGLGGLLLGLASSAVNTGIQSATGSPIAVNPAMTNQGFTNAITNPGSAGSTAPGVAGAAPAPGVSVGPQMGASPAGAVPPAGVAGTVPPAGMASAATPQGGMATAVHGGVPGVIGGAGTPSALSFTTISFGIVVTMMICMVMLMCRRCSKDDD